MIPTREGKFLGAAAPAHEADVTLLGVPFDGTSSFRSGSRFGPGAARLWSEVLETYSPEMGMDLEDVRLCDLGDLDIPVSQWPVVERLVCQAVDAILDASSLPVLIGGEHLISLPAVRTVLARFPDLAVVHIDAHLDLRDRYQDQAYSHATVLRRVADLVGPERLIQWGMRSGTREEWDWALRNRTLATSAGQVVERIAGRPIYLTLDLDVLDPSVMPETGTPEPGGMTFREIQALIMSLKGQRIAGADVVEYCPAGVGGGPSGAAAAKCVREIVLLACAGNVVPPAGAGTVKSPIPGSAAG